MTDRIATLTAEIARIQRQLANPDLPLETRSRLSHGWPPTAASCRSSASRAQTTREGQLGDRVALADDRGAGIGRARAGPLRPGARPGRRGARLGGLGLVLLLVAVGPFLLLGLLVWLGLRAAHRRADDRLLERA